MREDYQQRGKNILNTALKVVIIGLFINALPFLFSLIGQGLSLINDSLPFKGTITIFFESIGWLAIPMLFYAFNEILDEYVNEMRDNIGLSIKYLIAFTIFFLLLFSINIIGQL